MFIREYRSEDHAMLMRWWKAHGWPGVSKAILPKLGLIIENNGKPVVAGFLYMDNSVGVAFLEWVVGSPDASGKEIVVGIGVLVDFMGKRAKQLDYGILITACRQEALVRLYEKNGFQKTDEGLTHLIKLLP
jgi:hypothetical protein